MFELGIISLDVVELYFQRKSYHTIEKHRLQFVSCWNFYGVASVVQKNPLNKTGNEKNL